MKKYFIQNIILVSLFLTSLFNWSVCTAYYIQNDVSKLPILFALMNVILLIIYLKINKKNKTKWKKS